MNEITVLRRRIPFPSKVQLAFLFALIAWSVIPYPNSERQWRDALLAFLLFGGFAMLRRFLDLGYKSWYDERRLFVRKDVLGWIAGRSKVESIAFADTVHVRGAFDRGEVLKKRFMPFDHIRVEGKTNGDDGFVIISPDFLRVNDVRLLLLTIEQGRSEVMSHEVAEFAHSSAPW